VSPTTAAVLKLVHYFGFIMAVGGSFAAQRVMRLARQHSAAQRAGAEAAARAVVVSVELVGAFVALIAGIALLVADDMRQLKPATSGAGPWLHVKLTLVMIALVVAHLRMFRLARLVRGRDAGASEAECDALAKSALMLGSVDLALYVLIVFVAIFRYVLFVNA
jgi:uncharacterized membrane protein